MEQSLDKGSNIVPDCQQNMTKIILFIKGLKKVLIAVLLIVVLFPVYFFSIEYFYPQMTERGQFGDMFGALNALFSGLAFLGVIYAILLQRSELELQRKELKLTRREMERSAKAQEGSEKALHIQSESLSRTTDQAFTPYIALGHDDTGQMHIKNLGKGIALNIAFAPGAHIIKNISLANISTLGAGEKKWLGSWDAKMMGYDLASKKDMAQDVSLNYADLLGHKYTASFSKDSNFREFVVVTQSRI